jgi:membrane protein implicated in regulation of membrane protease activity
MAEFIGSYAIWAIWIIFGVIFLFFLVTAPCHAVLLMPLVGLPLFWLMPLEYALPINLVIWLASPFLYRVIRRAMKKPLQDGFHSLIGTKAEVVSRLSPTGITQYLVRTGGELWTARCLNVLQPGEMVKISAVDGIRLMVERDNNDVTQTKERERADERHCH